MSILLLNELVLEHCMTETYSQIIMNYSDWKITIYIKSKHMPKKDGYPSFFYEKMLD